ncbi:hypothetical protein L288_02010 [Sphingobium quisquiliarum P25]|uniref:Uncharacterized protein n=1 Tax=Sphingobium quisquiliarum P25 TaxID=1329909 RepID=T0HLL8_9SPHN|nr:hypothetical protein [Sphingobium quisquiliarum]EQB13877.1 hypothetical protein L288_02010 [Sphingobium quisquiliarum P25]
MLAPISFDFDNDGRVDAITTTSATGLFGQDVAVLPPFIGFGSVPSSPTGRMSVSLGVDAATGMIIGDMSAPPSASIISPLTTVIDAQGSSSSVRTALGLDSGGYALRAGTNLLTFNPVRNWQSSDAGVAQDAGRLTTINLQLLALAAYFTDTSDPEDYAISLRKVSRHISAAMVTSGSLDFTTPASIVALMTASGQASVLDPPVPTDWRDAKADLIAKYMTAMPPRIRDEADIRAWVYTFRFFIMPELNILGYRWPNPAAPRIAAIQPADITAVAEYFRSAPAPVAGPLMAAPDYREITASSSAPNSLVLSGCATAAPTRLPTCSDWLLFRGSENTELTAADAVEPAKLTASLIDGNLHLTRAGTFLGLTRVTYQTRNSTGDMATGIIFVRVRAPD